MYMYKEGQNIIRQFKISKRSKYIQTNTVKWFIFIARFTKKNITLFFPYLNMTITLINVAAFDLMLLCLRNNTLILLIWPLIGFNFINFQLHVCIPCCFSRKQTHIQSILI